MENTKYSTKLNGITKFILILFPNIILGFFLYEWFAVKGENYLYLFLFMLWGSFLGFIKYFKIPSEIQMFDNAINLKSLFGQDNFILMKDLISIEKGIANSLIIRTRKEKYFGVNGFSGLEEVIDQIKKSSPYFTASEKTS